MRFSAEQMDTSALLPCTCAGTTISSARGQRRPTTAFLYVYVSDAAATYQLALKAGAQSIEAPLDTPYGDRRAMVKDDWGNTWQIATRAADRESA